MGLSFEWPLPDRYWILLEQSDVMDIAENEAG
jgi:hypothetical protein